MSQIHEKDALFLRQHVGTAEAPEGHQYEMSLINGFVPALESKKTGRYFVLDWNDIINQARDAGIDEEPKE